MDGTTVFGYRLLHAVRPVLTMWLAFTNVSVGLQLSDNLVQALLGSEASRNAIDESTVERPVPVPIRRSWRSAIPMVFHQQSLRPPNKPCSA